MINRLKNEWNAIVWVFSRFLLKKGMFNNSRDKRRDFQDRFSFDCIYINDTLMDRKARIKLKEKVRIHLINNNINPNH
jgi:hypothetical protein